MLDRIADVDATLKSYATVMAEQALPAAQAAEREIRAGRYRGPLHGVPVAVKDLCCTKGVRTMGGTPVLEGFVPDFDATVVSRLRDAGAVLLGKLNLTEGAMAGYHPERDIPLNPWDRGRWPGMSSSGSGVAAAAGSLFRRDRHRHRRIDPLPVVGLRRGGTEADLRAGEPLRGAAAGRVAGPCGTDGPRGRRRGRSCSTRSRGAIPRTPRPYRSRLPARPRASGRGVEGLRIGVDREYALAGIDRGQAVSIEEALKLLVCLGARVVDVHMPDLAGVDRRPG